VKSFGAMIGAGITRARSKLALKKMPTYRRAQPDTSGYNPRTGRITANRNPYNPQRKVRPKACKGVSAGTDAWYDRKCD
jgi:hypothetical protein